MSRTCRLQRVEEEARSQHEQLLTYRGHQLSAWRSVASSPGAPNQACGSAPVVVGLLQGKLAAGREAASAAASRGF